MTTRSLDSLLREVSVLGFEKLFEIPFENGQKEKFFVFYHHDDGIFLEFDTCNETKSLDWGTFYYQWVRDCTIKEYSKNISCLKTWGGWTHHMDGGKPDVYIGFHHIPNKNLTKTIKILRKCGYFVPSWVEQGPISLIHSGDFSNDHNMLYGIDNRNQVCREHLAIQNKRIDMLPQKVRTAMHFSEN